MADIIGLLVLAVGAAAAVVYVVLPVFLMIVGIAAL